MKIDMDRLFDFLYIVALLFLLWAMSLMFGCSGDFYARKAIKKGVNIVRTEVITKVDTVWQIREVVDTLFKYRYDTVRFTKDSVRVVYFHNTKDSLVYLEIDCPDCPEITTTTIVDNTAFVIQEKPFFKKVFSWIKTRLIIILVGLAIIGIVTILLKFK